MLKLRILFAAALAAGAVCVAAGPGNWVGDLSPIAAEDWNYERAAHLLERAGFGGTPDEIQVLASLSPQDAVGRLVRYQEVKDVELPAFIETGIHPTPTWTRQANIIAFAAILQDRLDKLLPAQRAFLMDDARTGVTPADKRIAKTDKQAVVDKFYYWNFADGRETNRVDTWLADRMLRTRHPLQEKLDTPRKAGGLMSGTASKAVTC